MTKLNAFFSKYFLVLQYLNDNTSGRTGGGGEKVSHCYLHIGIQHVFKLCRVNFRYTLHQVH